MDKDVVPVFTGILLRHTKEWNNVTCHNMDGPRDDHTDTFMWNLKYDTDEPIYETEGDSRSQRTGMWLPGGGEWRGGMGVRDWQMQTITHRVETNKVLLHGTGNQNQDPAVNQNGGGYEEDCRHKRITKLLCCKAEVYTSIKIFKKIYACTSKTSCFWKT